MGPELGLQLFSVRASLQRDAAGTLERIAEIGYRHLQPAVQTANGADHVAGPLGAAELRRLLDGLGMDVQSVHARVDERTDWDRLVALNHELGSAAVAVPIAFFTDRASAEAYAGQLNRYGETCRKHGLRFYYHNHFHEFQVLGGQAVMDLLVEHTDPDLVWFELDTYWAARGGADPLAWLEKLQGRCDLVHQKDLPAAARPIDYFELFGRDAPITMQELLRTQQPEQFAEIGEGTMDVAGLVAAMRRIGVAYVFVEQDMTPRDEIESIRISYRNMTELLQR